MKKEFSTLSKAVKTALFAGLVVSTSAMAADTNEEKDLKAKKLTKEDIERIEVRGFAASVEKSINMKRFSNSIVDAVSAEDIGKFPDQTVADALQRVPGVQVEKDLTGESNKVSIRGTAPNLNITLLNGQSVASSSASASVTRPTRGFNYGLLPAEMVDTLEVYKSAEADIDEGSIGGTVVVKTRKPLNSEANYAAFSTKGIYNENAEETNPHFSGIYSWKNEDQDFGFNIGFVHKENGSQRDSEEVRFGYRDTGLGENDEKLYMPAAVGYNRYGSDSELDTITSTLQYAPSDDLEFLFTALNSKNEHTSFGTYSSGFFRGTLANVENPVIEDGTIVEGDLPFAENQAYYGNAGYKGEYDTQAYDLKTTYSADDYTITVQTGYSKAEGEVSDTYSEYFAASGAHFDVSTGTPSVELDNDLVAEDYSLGYNHMNEIFNESEEKYIQFDFEYDLDGDFITAIKTGVKYREHTKGASLMKTQYNVNDADGNPFTLAEFADGSVDNGILFGFDNNKFAEWQVTADKKHGGTYEHLDYAYDLKETITAAYVKAEFEFDKFRGNFGFRNVETEVDSTSKEYTGFSWAPENIQDIGFKQDYNDFLPSLNVNYDYSDDLVLRFAAAKVMSRPDYDFLSARKSGYCSAWSGMCKGSKGNPELDPYRATQVDLSAEWYFNESSILSVAYFHKDIDSYIKKETFEEYWDWSVEDDETGEVTTTKELFYISQAVNGEGGTNSGFEVNYSQKLGYGFGLLANYTYSDADMDETAAQKEAGEEAILPNNSEDTFNSTVYWENDVLSARLSYTYRSEYYYSKYIDLNQFRDGFGQYDLNVSYDINENFNVLFQAINLTNEEQKTFAGDYTGNADSDRPLAVHDYGRRLLVGVQAKF